MQLLRLVLIVIASLVQAGCLSVGIPLGPQYSDKPLLYADPGVIIKRPGVGTLRFTPGMELSRLDRVQTNNGKAVIDYDNGNIVVLNADTAIELGSIRLFLGEVFARIKQATRRGGGQVITDEISASVSGTEYLVRRRPGTTGRDDSESDVIVRSGRVYCEPGKTGRWQAFDLTANQMFVAGIYTSRAQVVPVDAMAQTRWADAAIQRLLRPRPRQSGSTIFFPIGFPSGKPDRDHHGGGY